MTMRTNKPTVAATAARRTAKPKTTKAALEAKHETEQLRVEQEEVDVLQHHEVVTHQKEAERTKDQNLAHRLLGQAQAFDFTRKTVTVAFLRVVKEVKDRKLYKGLTFMSGDGKLLTISTFEDYCRLGLGFSRGKVDQDILNLSTFGDEFMEAAQQIGLGYRDLRKLRSLPEDDRMIAINDESVQAGDRDGIIALIDDMAARHAKKAGELEAQITDLKEDAAAKDKVLKDKSEQIDRMNIQLSRRSAVEGRLLDEAEALNKFNLELRAAIGGISGSLAKLEGVMDGIFRYYKERRGVPQAIEISLINTVMEIGNMVEDLRHRNIIEAPLQQIFEGLFPEIRVAHAEEQTTENPINDDEPVH